MGALVMRARLEDRMQDPEVPASLFTQARLLDDSLGLSPRGRKELRWRVAEDDADGESGSVRLRAV